MKEALTLQLSTSRRVQALEAVEKAVACNPDNAEMKRKARDLRKLAGGGVSRAKADKENQVSSNHADAPQPLTPSLEERPPLKVKPPGCAAGSIVCCFAREYALASRNFTCCMHSLHHYCAALASSVTAGGLGTASQSGLHVTKCLLWVCLCNTSGVAHLPVCPEAQSLRCRLRSRQHRAWETAMSCFNSSRSAWREHVPASLRRPCTS